MKFAWLHKHEINLAWSLQVFLQNCFITINCLYNEKCIFISSFLVHAILWNVHETLKIHTLGPMKMIPGKFHGWVFP